MFRFFSALVGKEPISNGITKFSETLLEKFANVVWDKLSDKSKKHFENAFEHAVERLKMDLEGKDYNEKALDKVYDVACKKSFKAFVDESNERLKIVAFMNEINKAFSEEDKLQNLGENFVDNLSDKLCYYVYDFIMQETDDNGGDKLKEQFSASLKIHREVMRKALRDANARIEEGNLYGSFHLSFKNDGKMLPKELLDDIVGCELYIVDYYIYYRLDECIDIFFNLDDCEEDDQQDYLDAILSIFENYGINKEDILLYV